MKTIALILPYFGKLPNWFNLWLKTAGHNKTIDFYLITDLKINDQIPDNVKIVEMSFDVLKRRVEKLLNLDIVLDAPYKLCDYKPAYGYIFESIVRNYDFWGHCDSDVIFGDLRKFITNSVLENNDKVFSRGHLTIYRNNDYMNKFFMIKHNYKNAYTYNEAFTTRHSCGFDEWGDPKFGNGLSWVAEKMGIKTYDEVVFADLQITKENFNFEIGDVKYDNVIFRWENGKLFSYYIKDNELFNIELAYAHFQKREMRNTLKSLDKEFIILPNYFAKSNNSALRSKILSIESNNKNINIYWLKLRINILKTRIKRGAINQFLYRYRKTHF